MIRDCTQYDEDTLGKVQAAITGQGIWGQPCLDLITAMQNAGILFRERAEETEPDPVHVPDGIVADRERVKRLQYESRLATESQLRDEYRPGPAIPIYVRMAADADEARQEYEQDASGLGVPILPAMSEDRDELGNNVESGDLPHPGISQGFWEKVPEDDREQFSAYLVSRQESPALYDDVEVTQAELPVEDRLTSAFLNGFNEGFRRATWGNRLDA